MREGRVGRLGSMGSPGHGITPAPIVRLVSHLGVACCAIIALVLLASPSAVSAFAARARMPTTPQSCGQAASAPGVAQPAARASAMAPQLTLNPAQGAAGTKIVATGSGWPQGASVTVTARAYGQGIESEPATSATVQSDGSLALTLAAPAASCHFTPEVGQVIQIVAETASGAQSATANFTFTAPTPTISAPPDGGQVAPSAVTLPVRGTSWGAGTTVMVWATTPSTPANVHDPWLPPLDIPVVVLSADSGGRIAGAVPLAPTLLPLRPGVVLGLAASASSPDYGQVITYLPTAYDVGLAAQPTLAASQLAVAQGNTIHVSGDHWWPGDSLRLLYCPGAPHPTKGSLVRCNPAQSTALGVTLVDASGHFATTIAIPATAPAGVGTLEASVSGEFDDPFTATQALRVTPSANVGAWLAGTLGPAAPLVALALLALAGVLAAVWWIAQRRVGPRAAARR